MFEQYLIIGNLGRDPEMRFTPNGAQVTSFTVAVNRQYKNQAGEKVKKTKWVKVSVWNKLAEVCNEYLHKGSKVLVIGHLDTDEAGNPRIWKDKDGNPRASFEMTAESVQFLSSNGNGNGNGETETPAEEEMIPFGEGSAA